MPLFVWDDSYSVAVSEFDAQHQRLLGYVNELYDAVQERRSRDVLGRILDNLINYTVTHFAAEERLMVQYDYPDYAAHKAEHEKLKQKVTDFKRDFEESGAAISISILTFLNDWVKNHIRVMDKKYSEFFNSRGVA